MNNNVWFVKELQTFLHEKNTTKKNRQIVRYRSRHLNYERSLFVSSPTLFFGDISVSSFTLQMMKI